MQTILKNEPTSPRSLATFTETVVYEQDLGPKEIGSKIVVIGKPDSGKTGLISDICKNKSISPRSSATSTQTVAREQDFVRP